MPGVNSGKNILLCICLGGLSGGRGARKHLLNEGDCAIIPRQPQGLLMPGGSVLEGACARARPKPMRELTRQHPWPAKTGFAGLPAEDWDTVA